LGLKPFTDRKFTEFNWRWRFMHPNLGVSTGFTGRDCNQQLSINRLPSFLSTKSPIYNSHEYQEISILMIKLSRNRKNIPGVQNLPKMYSDPRGSAAKKLSTGPIPSRLIIKKIYMVCYQLVAHEILPVPQIL